MLQEKAAARDEVALVQPVRLDGNRALDKHSVLQVLERAARDSRFISQLTDQGERALQGYDLTWREKAALLSGDIAWIEAQVGKLTARQRTWIECRLEQEIW